MKDNEEVYKERKTVHTGCIAITGYSLFEIEEFGAQIGIPVLNGERNYRPRLHFENDDIFLSDLEQTKGYEFDTIVIINCEEGILPPAEMPKEEIYRFVSQFYVAMTRAKHQLIFSFSKNLSSWLDKPSLGLSSENWFDYVDEDACKPVGYPGKLPDFPNEEINNNLEITGSQFVYTQMARGLDSSVLERISQIIDGKGLIRDKKPLKWRTVLDAVTDMRGQGGRGRHEIFGPKSDADILENVEKETLRNTLFMQRTSSSQEIGRTKAAVAVKIASTPSSTGQEKSRAPKEPLDDLHSAQNIKNPGEDGISKLELSNKLLMICHSLDIKYVKDIEKLGTRANKQKLTKMEIKLLKSKAKLYLKNNSGNPLPNTVKQSLEIKNLTSPISSRLRFALKAADITNLEELNLFSERELLRSPRIGRGEMNQLRELALKNGIRIRKS